MKSERRKKPLKKPINIVLAALLSIGILLSTFNMPNASAASQVNIDTAITKGLAYLASTQGTDGGWHDNTFPVASTAMAVLAFENDGNLPGGSSIYHTNVEKGIDYLLSQAQEETMTLQDGNNPDSNGNTIGIWFGDYDGAYSGYETGMVLMALVGSQSQGRLATTGPENGRNCHDIAVDIVDWLPMRKLIATQEYTRADGGTVETVEAMVRATTRLQDGQF